jgi:hypothetical protein
MTASHAGRALRDIIAGGLIVRWNKSNPICAAAGRERGRNSIAGDVTEARD